MAEALLLVMLLFSTAFAIRRDPADAGLFEQRPRKYSSNFELERKLKDFSKRCSNISRLYSIGKSVKGASLWVLEISDRPGKPEPEPSFKLIGNMHGDEPVGRELILLLSEWLCGHYPRDPLAKLIVENAHLHLLPSMNPDGFTNKTRNNANGVDLNRDFPDQFYTTNNDESTRQPETVAVMNWIRTNRFVASASLHEGAVVANYPWDGTADGRTGYSKCSDDNTFRFLASIYSNFHKNMSKSSEFPGGITNGAAWYPLYGGMQDWNYIHGHCLELTLEICESKWPPPNEIETLWLDNRLGILELVASVAKTGLHGKVQSSRTGIPLAATISVEGYDQTVVAGPFFGDYHRLLSPGEAYEVTASMPGYVARTSRVILPEDGPANLDFILDPLAGIAEEEQRLIHMMATRSDRLSFYDFGLTSVCFVFLGTSAIVYVGFRRRGRAKHTSRQ